MVERPGRASRSRVPIAMALIAVALVLINLWTWAKTSNLSYLVAAAAFAAMGPSFFFSPLDVRKSFKENEAVIGEIERPAWVTGLTLVGVLLLVTSVAMRLLF